MPGGPERDRDVRGRPRNDRPRDGLGRPLPRGSAGVPRVSDDVVLPPVAALAEAQRLLDQGLPFHAHEILEGTWKGVAADDERAFWQGLAQLAVALTHLGRGNVRGAAALLRRGGGRISGYRPARYGVDVAALVRWAAQVADQLESLPSDRAGTSLGKGPRPRVVPELDLAGFPEMPRLAPRT